MAKSFRYARDRYKQRDFFEIKMKLIRKRNTDGRSYNLPTVSKVAVLVVGDLDESAVEMDIIIETQSRLLQKIDVCFPCILDYNIHYYFHLERMALDRVFVFLDHQVMH